jgi:hypothetical protein
VSHRASKRRGLAGERDATAPTAYVVRLQAAAPERLKSLRAKIWDLDQIAARINEDGILTRTGRSWQRVVINRLSTDRR